MSRIRGVGTRDQIKAAGFGKNPNRRNVAGDADHADQGKDAKLCTLVGEIYLAQHGAVRLADLLGHALCRMDSRIMS